MIEIKRKAEKNDDHEGVHSRPGIPPLVLRLGAQASLLASREAFRDARRIAMPPDPLPGLLKF